MSVCLLLMAACSYGDTILSPGDTIIGIDADGWIAGSNSSYPANEAPIKALDGDTNTKYLNFAGRNTGFIVTPYSSGILQSFTITTANDDARRDPIAWAVYGTNDAITSSDNSTGLSETWTLIDSGSVALPDARYTLGPVVTVNNTTLYSSYKMIYTDLKNNNQTLMQVADVAFYQTSDGTGLSFLGTSDSILAIQPGNWDSRYPTAEGPANILDGNPDTKYLNFGKANAGFIVTPSKGASVVRGFQITTANDWDLRDPASWALYGTNDAILSGKDSDGLGGENWVLIDSGDLSLPSERKTAGDIVAVDNNAYYTSYKMVFTSLNGNNIENPPSQFNSMQIADIQFFDVPEPVTMVLLGMGGLALLRRRQSL